VSAAGVSAEQAAAVLRAADRVLDRDAVDAAYGRLAAGIHAGFAGCNPLVLVCMVGGMIPAVALLSRLDIAGGERIRKYPDRYINHIFGEHEFGGTSWMILSGVEFQDLALEEGLTSEPLPAIATSYLGVVPLVITIYPGLLMGMYAFSQRRQAVARREREAAVAQALKGAEEESQKKLGVAAERAKKDKERAVDAAVVKALADARKGGAS